MTPEEVERIMYNAAMRYTRNGREGFAFSALRSVVLNNDRSIDEIRGAARGLERSVGINYQDLLAKYMAMVRTLEGTTFLDCAKGYNGYADRGSEFTSTELDALCQVEKGLQT